MTARGVRGMLCAWGTWCALLAVAGCGFGRDDDDAALLALITERDQLRREIDGLRDLEEVARIGLIRSDRELLVRVDGQWIQSLLAAALPVTIDVRGGTVRLDSVQLQFRSNVARVELIGTVRRASAPRIAATLRLRGALEDFAVDSARSLRARIAIDATDLSSPTGVPGALGTAALGFLQGVVDRALPEIREALPVAELPVRLDRELRLPGFGPEGALSVAPADAPLSLGVSRIIAFENALVAVLRVERGAFVRVTR